MHNALGLYSAGRTAEAYRESAVFDPLPLYLFGVTAAVGILLGGLALFPAVEFLGLSHRVVSIGLADMLELKQLVTLVVPNFYGSPVAPLHYWGVGNYGEQTIYTGAVALILALAAPVVHKKFFTG